jgi:ABC-type nitrate/sulfonate/bicarbonate transport system substrate-binding protein
MGMKVTQRRAIAGGLGVLLALAVGACSSSGGSSGSGSNVSGGSGGSGSTASNPTKITLVLPSLSSNQSVAFLAQGLGTFKKNGLDVKTVVSGTGALAVAAAVSGSGQFVMSGGSDMMSAVSKGQHLVFIARGLGGGLAAQLVLTNAAAKKTGLPASATPQQKAKALNGLTIASPSAASSQTTQAEKAAASVGAKINFTYVAPTAMDAAMKAGHIDGIVQAPPFTTGAVYDGSGVMWLDGPAGTFPGGFDVPTYGDPMVETTASYAQAHPAVVTAFVKSILEAVTMAKADSAKASAIVKKATFPDMAAAEWNQIWASVVPLLQPSLNTADITSTISLDGFDGKVTPDQVFPASVQKLVNAAGS